MNLTQLNETLKGEPAYRLKQAKKAVLKDLIDNWNKATTLPLNLRKLLNKESPLSINGELFFSKDQKTAKALITLKDDLKIESVLMRHHERNTVCVSSQVGCPLACKFCATGRMGFKRNLEPSEIVEQVLFFARYLKKSRERVTNIVFMGMGEPFLNYKNVILAIRILNDKEGFNLGARKISISTVGITEGIKKLAQEKLQVNLAISLHAPDDKLRSQLIPVGKKYNIKKILETVDDYIKKTNRKVMFEYLMIKGLNDSNELAKELAKLMKKNLYLVNLISYNPTGCFQPSSKERIKIFKQILEKEGVLVTERYRFGREIKAACGQLATKKYN
jgi:23S rRNA (adenine2503-C2)-methyltransferase